MLPLIYLQAANLAGFGVASQSCSSSPIANLRKKNNNNRPANNDIYFR